MANSDVWPPSSVRISPVDLQQQAEETVGLRKMTVSE
jgi:hypothetical protein